MANGVVASCSNQFEEAFLHESGTKVYLADNFQQMNTLVITEDGSHTIFSERFGEHYHSVHGAIQESKHIFIESGLKQCKTEDINILEIGFGTGLNALLSFIEGVEHRLSIRYTALELHPLDQAELKEINYTALLGYGEEYRLMHDSAWEQWVEIKASFKLKKLKADLRSVIFDDCFDLVYFDAFSPEVQPDLWKEEIFNKIAKVCNSGGILTTYSAKGAVRRSLQAVGFAVERIPGPPGKREIIRARVL